jgi:hypothetical protein
MTEVFRWQYVIFCAAGCCAATGGPVVVVCAGDGVVVVRAGDGVVVVSAGDGVVVVSSGDVAVVVVSVCAPTGIAPSPIARNVTTAPPTTFLQRIAAA